MSVSETRFAGDFDDERLANEPPPINVVALIAFVISLGSFLFVSDKVFFFLPALAIILSVVALLTNAFSKRGMWGAGFAIIALFLSLFFVTWRVSYERMRVTAVQEESIPIGTKWLEFLQRKQFMEAHQLTVDFSSREMEGKDLAYAYRELGEELNLEPDQLSEARKSSMHTRLDGFMKGPLLQLFATHGENTTVQHVATIDHRREDNRKDHVRSIYSVTYTDENGELQTRKFLLAMEREDRGAYFNAHWSVRSNTLISDNFDPGKEQLKTKRIRQPKIH